jgi:hypothetical protein
MASKVILPINDVERFAMPYLILEARANFNPDVRVYAKVYNVRFTLVKSIFFYFISFSKNEAKSGTFPFSLRSYKWVL